MWDQVKKFSLKFNEFETKVFDAKFDRAIDSIFGAAQKTYQATRQKLSKEKTSTITTILADPELQNALNFINSIEMISVEDIKWYNNIPRVIPRFRKPFKGYYTLKEIH